MGKSRGAPTPSTASDQYDLKLVASAAQKVRAGQTLTRQERSALKKFESAKEEERRWQYYQTVPKRHYLEMSGRQTRTLHEQADLYGAPLRGPTIDLSAVIRWLHDFLAANRHKLASTDGEVPMTGESSPALELWRQEKYRLARLERLEREQKLLPRDQVHDGLARLSGLLRVLGETLQRQFGAEAQQLFEEALDDYTREVGTLFGDGHDDTQPDARDV